MNELYQALTQHYYCLQAECRKCDEHIRVLEARRKAIDEQMVQVNDILCKHGNHIYEHFEDTKKVIERGGIMNKTIQKPLACRNAHCGAMCAIGDAEFWGEYPNCPNYERRDDLYQNHELLDKIEEAREEIRKLDDINPDYTMDRTIHVNRNEVLAIIDRLIESEETE